jgi:hypothetical protein
MTDHSHQINLALRTAAGHARAAHDAMSAADKTYEMKMKSAGAAVYEAWGLAVRAQPEYEGRKIDDKALVRIYESTKPRPWWDKHLSAIKVEGKPGDREWAKRTLQWHLDPDAARARRAQAVVRSESYHRRVKEAAAKGARSGGSNAPSQPSTEEMRKVGKAAELGMGYVPVKGGGQSGDYGNAWATPDEIDRLLARIRKATRGLNDDRLRAAADLLENVVEQLERL